VITVAKVIQPGQAQRRFTSWWLLIRKLCAKQRN